MDTARISAILDFLQAAENLKNTIRSTKTSIGRAESTAEHTWRLLLLVQLFADELGDVDQLKLFKLCIIHDLGEAISGDIPAIHVRESIGKAEREKRDLLQLCAPLPEDLRGEIVALWEEYQASQSAEAILAKGFDKLETMLQHNVGKNAPDFDYRFNLTYGAANTDRHPLLQQIRELVDAVTRQNMNRSCSEP